jgi:Bacterial dnaA protein helix-turn-helix
MSDEKRADLPAPAATASAAAPVPTRAQAIQALEKQLRDESICTARAIVKRVAGVATQSRWKEHAEALLLAGELLDVARGMGEDDPPALEESPPLPSPVPHANDGAGSQPRFVPVLELLERIDASSAIRTVARELARHTLHDDEDRTWLHVAGEVARAEAVTVEELLEHTRSRSLVPARRRFWYELRKATGRSYPELGRVLGWDHTTIMDGVRAASSTDAAPASQRRRVGAA